MLVTSRMLYPAIFIILRKDELYMQPAAEQFNLLSAFMIFSIRLDIWIVEKSCNPEIVSQCFKNRCCAGGAADMKQQLFFSVQHVRTIFFFPGRFF